MLCVCYALHCMTCITGGQVSFGQEPPPAGSSPGRAGVGGVLMGAVCRTTPRCKGISPTLVSGFPPQGLVVKGRGKGCISDKAIYTAQRKAVYLIWLLYSPPEEAATAHRNGSAHAAAGVNGVRYQVGPQDKRAPETHTLQAPRLPRWPGIFWSLGLSGTPLDSNPTPHPDYSLLLLAVGTAHSPQTEHARPVALY